MKKNLLLLFVLTSFIVNAQTAYQVSTFVGSGVDSNTPGGTGTAASIDAPTGLCLDHNGNVYMNTYGGTILKITPEGVVSLWADLSSRGSQTLSLCADMQGNLYTVQWDRKAIHSDNMVQKIDATGKITTIAYLPGADATYSNYKGMCYSSGFLYATSVYTNCIYKIDITTGKYSIYVGSGRNVSTDGKGGNAAFAEPAGICADQSGNLFVAEASGKIRKIDASANVTTIANLTGSISLSGICVDASENIFVNDIVMNNVSKISSNGDITIIAGSTVGDKNGVGADAAFNFVYRSSVAVYYFCGIAIDPSNNLFLSDTRNLKIKKITPIVPAPPKPAYLDLPASMCLGSTVAYQPSVTGGQVGFTLISKTIATPPKAMCKSDTNVFVVDNDDNIWRYNLQGTGTPFQYPSFYSNISAIKVDKYNRLYVVAPDQNNNSLTSIYRLQSNGYPDFGWGGGSTPSGSFSAISTIALGPDGKLYAADTLTGFISTVDTITATPANLPSPATQYSFYKPTSIAFSKDGRMFVADAGRKDILVRNSTDNNYYPAFTGLDTLNWAFNSIDIDTSSSIESFYVSASNPSRVAAIVSQNILGNIITVVANYADQGVAVQKPGSVLTVFPATGAPVTWVADKGANNIQLIQLYAYSITPSLPKGLVFNFNTGQITGTPTVAAPPQIYTVTVKNNLGSTTSTFAFSVNLPGSVSNTAGVSHSPVVNQGDGLSINYFQENNCAKMISVADSIGGSNPGNVQVNQTVYPTLASFSDANFVGRVTDINTQNPDAGARIKLYFTYNDIVNFNANNGTDPDLSNDIVGGTMQMGILQLHTDSTGHIEQIKHNPVTANWNTTDQNWVVDFPITKFSTFYAGESNTIAAFDCSNAGTPENVAACGNYTWHGTLYTASGTYHYNAINQNGCDSVLTLNLTVSNDFEITQDDETLTCNAAGATYKWVNCDNNYTVISGATQQTYIASSNGDYAVIATKNSCTDTSACVYVGNLTTTGINHSISVADILVYPNPGNGLYTINAPEDYTIIVISTLGETLLEKQIYKGMSTLDISSFASGVYYLNIRNSSGNNSKILIKK
jgi:streptogramin lyase